MIFGSAINLEIFEAIWVSNEVRENWAKNIPMRWYGAS